MTLPLGTGCMSAVNREQPSGVQVVLTHLSRVAGTVSNALSTDTHRFDMARSES